MSDDFLAGHFAPFGKVLRVSRHTDKGMAFVHFRTVEEAQRAVERMHQEGTLPGHMRLSYGKMFVYDDQGSELGEASQAAGGGLLPAPGGYRGAGGPYGSSESDTPTNILWVGDVTQQVTDDDLRTALEAYGPVIKIARVDTKNIAFVHFASVEPCMAAVKMNPRGSLRVGPFQLKIRYGKPPPGGGGGGYGGPTGGGGNFGGGGPPDVSRLITEAPTAIVSVTSLAPSTAEADVDHLFRPFDGFVRLALHGSGPSKVAIAEFDSTQNACECRMALTGQTLHGVPLRVAFATAFVPTGGGAGGGGGSAGGGALMLIPPGGARDITPLAQLPSEGMQSAGGQLTFTDRNGAPMVPFQGAAGGTGTGALPAYITRPRVAPKVGTEHKVAAVVAASYFSAGVAPPHAPQAQVFELCTAIDAVGSAEHDVQLLRPIFAQQVRLGTLHHGIAIAAKRLKEFHNDDLHKKLLVMYSVAYTLHANAPPNKAAIDAFAVLVAVVAALQSDEAMGFIRQTIDSLKTYLQVDTVERDAVLWAQFDAVLHASKSQNALASLLRRVKAA